MRPLAGTEKDRHAVAAGEDGHGLGPGIASDSRHQSLFLNFPKNHTPMLAVALSLALFPSDLLTVTLRDWISTSSPSKTLPSSGLLKLPSELGNCFLILTITLPVASVLAA